MILSFAEGIIFNLETAQRRPGYNRVIQSDPNAQAAVSIYDGVYKLRFERPLAAVWGPPGTGKTITYIVFFTKIYMDKEIYEKDFIHYVAPSNDLVVDTGSRLAAMLIAEYMKGSPRIGVKEFEEIVKSMRLYGSKIYAGSKRAVRQLADKFIDCGGGSCYERVAEALRSATTSPPDRETKFLLTTEFQDVVKKYSGYMEILTGSPKKELHLFADEASKAPYYAPFRTVEMLIDYVIMERLGGAKRLPRSLQNLDLVSLTVIGDHMQAIATDPEFHARKDLLLLLAVENRLRNLGVCSGFWKGKQCTMLEYTKRLPEPSHDPISKAYYKGLLKSMKGSDEALGPLGELATRLRRMALELEKTSPKQAKLLEAVADAISSRIPVVIVDVKQRFPSGSTFESSRVAAAYTIASALVEAARREGASGLDIVVSSIYTEMLEPFYTLKGVRPSTVQALLGGEADIHITMLGKEWYGSTPCIRPWQAARDDRDDRVTLYYREPELLNVQLSRHSRLLILVGNISHFKSQTEKAAEQAQQGRCNKYQREALEALKRAVELIEEYTGNEEFLRVTIV